MATFDYNDVRYEFDATEAYQKNMIVLPDGTVLRPGWIESSPRQLILVELVPAARATAICRVYGENEPAPASILDAAIVQVVKEIQRHEAARIERVIDDLCALAEEAGKPFHDAPKIRPATIAEGRYAGLVEAVATLRKHFPPSAGTEPKFLIQDSSQYVGNSVVWWGPNRSGYVTDLDQAGLYTEAEAFAQHRDRETDLPVRVDVARKAACLHVDAQRLRKVTP